MTFPDNYQSYIEAMPDAAVLIDENNSIKFFNSRAQSLLGLKKKKHLWKNLCQIIDQPLLTEFLSLDDIEDKITRGLEIQSPANANIFLSLSILPCTNNVRLLLASNISKMHRVNKMRKDFVANVSHELRTPLTVIKGYLELLGEQFVHHDQLSYFIEEMQLQSQRMENLVVDLLLLSKLEANADKDVGTELVCVPKMLNSLIKETKLLNQKKNHEITTNIDDKLFIAGNERELQSAFLNLINNAIRYTPKNGTIHIQWYKNNQTIFFSVTDNGEGIAKKHLHRLTERFYRVDKGRSRSEGGTGLGLAIVKHVLNHHNAFLEITSTVNKGSCFCCHFKAS